jgi:hypothetical protein
MENSWAGANRRPAQVRKWLKIEFLLNTGLLRKGWYYFCLHFNMNPEVGNALIDLDQS